MQSVQEQEGYLLTYHRHWSVARQINGDQTLAEYLAMRAERPETAIKPETGVVRVYEYDGERFGVMWRKTFEVGRMKNKPHILLRDATILRVLANNPDDMTIRLCGKTDITHASERLTGVDLSLLYEFYFGLVLASNPVTILGATNVDNMVKIQGKRNLQPVISY